MTKVQDENLKSFWDTQFSFNISLNEMLLKVLLIVREQVEKV